jgi:hypothetical protein
MAFYDVAGGMRLADLAKARTDGMNDGYAWRQKQMLQEFGPGIMNGDANALAEMAKYNPAAAINIKSKIASDGRAASKDAAEQFKNNLERDMTIAKIMGKLGKDPQSWDKGAAYLRDLGYADAGGLIGKFEEQKPIFDALSQPDMDASLKQLYQEVSLLPEDQRAAALQAGLMKRITGSAAKSQWRPATPEEARLYGAPAGQINEDTNEFKPAPANKSMKIQSDGKGGFTFTDGVEPKNATIGQAYNPAEVQGTLDLLREIKEDPALARATGPILGGNGNDIDAIPLWQRLAMGGGAVSVTSKINMLQSRAWLAARDMLKGGGAITDYESRKASQAVERLSRAQTHKDFVAALDDLESAIVSGMNKLESAGKLTEDDTKWLDQYLSGNGG